MLFLDEPTTGLDPRGRLGLWRLIGELTTQGTTVLLTTQYLEEADRLADSIVVLDRGRVIADRHRRASSRPGSAATGWNCTRHRATDPQDAGRGHGRARLRRSQPSTPTTARW